jgi:hypothetical protein
MSFMIFLFVRPAKKNLGTFLWEGPIDQKKPLMILAPKRLLPVFSDKVGVGVQKNYRPVMFYNYSFAMLLGADSDDKHIFLVR